MCHQFCFVIKNRCHQLEWWNFSIIGAYVSSELFFTVNFYMTALVLDKPEPRNQLGDSRELCLDRRMPLLNDKEFNMIFDEARSSLEIHHAKLENTLREELNRPRPDYKTVAEIKKQKLRIKDELSGNRVL